MAIKAPLSKYKKTNFKIYIVVCIALAIWCAYDGYFNKEWIKEHTNDDGTSQTYLVFNRNAPVYLVGAAVVFGAWLFVLRNKKLIADENEFILSGKERVSYNSIQKIDKTKFKSKGCFTITYKNADGGENDCRLNDRSYDNLEAVLDMLVEKIS